jgi:hypothetical protein
MTEQWLHIIETKRARRRELAALPLREKIKKFDALRTRLDQLRRFRPVVKVRSTPD